MVVNTTEYRALTNAIQRCENPNHPQWKDYGGRGIKVCERWRHSFKNFLSDMGLKPNRTLTLERRDNNGDYCLKNCCWATRASQSRNSRKRTRARVLQPLKHRPANLPEFIASQRSLGRTYQQIGELLGCSKQYVNQIEHDTN
jgi:hypothetical protein